MHLFNIMLETYFSSSPAIYFPEKTNYFSLFPNGLAKPIKYPKQVLFNFLKGSYREREREGRRLKCVIERKCNKGEGVTTMALSGLS